MNTLVTTAGFAILALAGSAAQASDFKPMMDVAQTTWPTKTHIGVIADYRQSRDDILDLARSAGSRCRITVLDVKQPSGVPVAGNQMACSIKPDFLVLLPRDPRVWEGSPNATRAIRQLAFHGVPVIGTTPMAIRQGAVFACGPETRLEVLVTERMIGTVEVILPRNLRTAGAAAPAPMGMAEVSVVGAF